MQPAQTLMRFLGFSFTDCSVLVVCICRFERDVRAPGNRAVGSGASLQLPHGGGEAGESVHYPERRPGQRGNLAPFLYVGPITHRLLTPTDHTRA